MMEYFLFINKCTVSIILDFVEFLGLEPWEHNTDVLTHSEHYFVIRIFNPGVQCIFNRTPVGPFETHSCLSV